MNGKKYYKEHTNPQKTEGKPYKIQEGNITDGHVYDKIKRGSIDTKETDIQQQY